MLRKSVENRRRLSTIHYKKWTVDELYCILTHYRPQLESGFRSKNQRELTASVTRYLNREQIEKFAELHDNKKIQAEATAAVSSSFRTPPAACDSRQRPVQLRRGGSERPSLQQQVHTDNSIRMPPCETILCRTTGDAENRRPQSIEASLRTFLDDDDDDDVRTIKGLSHSPSQNHDSPIFEYNRTRPTIEEIRNKIGKPL